MCGSAPGRNSEVWPCLSSRIAWFRIGISFRKDSFVALLIECDDCAQFRKTLLELDQVSPTGNYVLISVAVDCSADLQGFGRAFAHQLKHFDCFLGRHELCRSRQGSRRLLSGTGSLQIKRYDPHVQERFRDPRRTVGTSFRSMSSSPWKTKDLHIHSASF